MPHKANLRKKNENIPLQKGETAMVKIAEQKARRMEAESIQSLKGMKAPDKEAGKIQNRKVLIRVSSVLAVKPHGLGFLVNPYGASLHAF